MWKTFFAGVVVFKKVMFSENKSLFSENKSMFSENKRYMLHLTEDSGPFSGSSKMMVSWYFQKSKPRPWTYSLQAHFYYLRLGQETEVWFFLGFPGGSKKLLGHDRGLENRWWAHTVLCEGGATPLGVLFRPVLTHKVQGKIKKSRKIRENPRGDPEAPISLAGVMVLWGGTCRLSISWSLFSAHSSILTPLVC